MLYNKKIFFLKKRIFQNVSSFLKPYFGIIFNCKYDITRNQISTVIILFSKVKSSVAEQQEF